jgi:hypothetical protein
MLVKRRYERLVNTGNYENVKVSVELEHEVTIDKASKESVGAQIKSKAAKLGLLAKQIVDEEVKNLKPNEGATNGQQ